MSKKDDLRMAVSDLLEAVNGLVESASQLKWSPDDGVLPLIRSAIFRRQYECLSVAVDLVDKSLGFAAVALLRPACEEFLWAKYLASLKIPDAENLLVCMSRKELGDSLKAQDGHVGRTESERLGLAGHIKRNEASSKVVTAHIKALGLKLKWEKRAVEDGKLPSIAFIAKAVDEIKIYRFLYHASSRYVHFSPAELMRRAWGKNGSMTVSSAHFTDYWGAFVMYWGAYLMTGTFSILFELGGTMDTTHVLEADKLLSASRRIRDNGPVPIVTSEELDWKW